MTNIFSTYYEVHARTNNFQFGPELTEEKKIAQKTRKKWVTVPLIERGRKKIVGHIKHHYTNTRSKFHQVS